MKDFDPISFDWAIYRPVWLKHITAEDIPEIEDFLKDRWEYMKKQWEET